MDLDGDKRFPVSVAAGRFFAEMRRDREPSGRARIEAHLGHRARHDLFLDVVAVQVQAHAPIRAPLQLDQIALLDTDAPHVRGHVAVLDLQDERQLRCAP